MEHASHLHPVTNDISKSRRILMVWPKVPRNTYWSFVYAMKFVGKKSAMPPLGLITVAGMLPQTWELRLVDMNVRDLENEDILWADAVFVSAMLVQKESFQEIIARCKSLSRKVVAGGPLVTSCREDFSGIDACVIGEAEETINELVLDIENDRLKPTYEKPERPDISHSVMPRFDLLELNAYATMSVQYSRGCPFQCEFCDIWSVYGNRPRLKSAECLVSEIDELYRLGWQGSIFVVDDNFIGNRKRVRTELLPALTQWQRSHRYPFPFFTEASINLAEDPPLMTAMRDAGFDEVFIGIESPSTASLTETGKRQNTRSDLLAAVNTIQRHGLEVMGGFIVGFDSDTSSIFDQQVDFIQRAGIPKAMVGLLGALPGTKLYRRLMAEGRIVGTTSGNNTSDGAVNFRPRMPLNDLLNGYHRVLDRIYDVRMSNYFKRCNRMLDNVKNRASFLTVGRWQSFRIFIRSLVIQTLSPYGFKYLLFLARNLLRHAPHFPAAVRLAVQGHHFRAVTQQTIRAARVSSAMEEQYQYLRCQLSRYSSEVMANSRRKIRQLEKLFDQASHNLTRLNRRIGRIHSDFRGDLAVRYSSWSRDIYNLFRPYRSELARVGVVLR